MLFQNAEVSPSLWSGLLFLLPLKGASRVSSHPRPLKTCAPVHSAKGPQSRQTDLPTQTWWGRPGSPSAASGLGPLIPPTFMCAASTATGNTVKSWDVLVLLLCLFLRL